MTTSKPTTLGELQLYKVLQRSNLLSYYEAFISQGGDDVQQLCEAGQEEFLEIMALVEMASKPLHVRRLQKALQEWVTRPQIFQNINLNYLPSQSIPLTALGFDASELMVPVQSPSSMSNCFTYNRDTSSAPPGQDGDMASRTEIPMEYANGHSLSNNRPINGKEGNGLSRNEHFRKRNLSSNSNHASANHDLENADGKGIMNLLQAVVQRLASPSRNHENMEVIAKLKAEGRHSDLVSALEGKDQGRLEMEIKQFVKTHKTADGTAISRHEILLSEAAVKLAMTDKRYLLKKNELMTLAEKAVSEVENNFSNKRRSSHLHGSSCQNRIQEINGQLQDIKTQRQALQKRLSEVKALKNVIRENEYQSRLERCSREEVVLLQERNELNDKLQGESKEYSVQTTPPKKTSFSSELADLAKAHNLSFGNPQSTMDEIALPVVPWGQNESSPKYPRQDSSNFEQSGASSPLHTDFSSKSSYNSRPSPPPLKRIEDVNSEILSDSFHVKTEDKNDVAAGFPSNSNAITAKGVKRKHVSGSPSAEEKNLRNKKSPISSDINGE